MARQRERGHTKRPSSLSTTSTSTRLRILGRVPLSPSHAPTQAPPYVFRTVYTNNAVDGYLRGYRTQTSEPGEFPTKDPGPSPRSCVTALSNTQNAKAPRKHKRFLLLTSEVRSRMPHLRRTPFFSFLLSLFLISSSHGLAQSATSRSSLHHACR